MEISRALISACPLCSGAVRPLGVTEKYVLQPLGTSVAIEYACCDGCGFVMQRDPVVGAALGAYYANSPRYRAADVSGSEARLYAEQAAFMASGGRLRGASVLDIGADMGKLLDHLRAEYSCSTHYQEESSVAKAYLASHGRHREVQDLDASGRYDWIVLSQVLEHIIQPVSYLTRLRANLTGNGMLFVEIPNHSFWDDRDYGFSFEHVNYFSVATLTAALDQAGYVVTHLSVASDQRYFSGRGRIIRAIAAVKDESLIAALPEAVRRHHRRGMHGKFVALERMARDLQSEGRPSLALYAVGELAEQLFVNTGIAADQIAAVFDSDARKYGRLFHGIGIRPASEITAVNPSMIVVMSGAEADIRRTIDATGYAGRVLCWSEIEPAD